MKHLLVTGGGTAGHVMPAIPIMQAMLARGTRVSFIGGRGGLEEDLLRDLKIDFHGISAGKLRRYFSWQNVVDAGRVVLGMLQAVWLMGRLRPQVVFSKGGFVSFPVVVAAWLWRIPVVAHESDSTPGLANRLAMPFVAALCTAFDHVDTGGFTGRVVATGTPIREQLLAGDAGRGRAFVGIDDDTPILVVTGGSLGADVLNEAVRRAVPVLCESHVVVHVCGPGKIRPLLRPQEDTVMRDATRYRPYEFIGAQWGDVLAAADVVVSRAGANALFELLALGKPNVLVPLSKQASRGDQLENAAFAEQQGLSVVVFEEDLSDTALQAAIVAAGDQQRRESIAGFAANYQKDSKTPVDLICNELDRAIRQ